MIAMIQFQNQLDEVDRPTPRDRMGRGKTSPMTTHAHGPHCEGVSLAQCIMGQTAEGNTNGTGEHGDVDTDESNHC
jgi:hypothetical protein